MKLLRLQVNVPFRSLAAGFELHFLREWDRERCFEFHPYCLVGRNGSGKSNVLEALAAIFYHIECIYLDYRPDGFEFDRKSNPDGFRAEVCAPDAFELEYLIPVSAPDSAGSSAGDLRTSAAHVRISKLIGQRPEIQWLNRNQFEENAPITSLGRSAVKSLLPKYVVGYSSGHNEILSLPFFKMRFIHFDEYRQLLVEAKHYAGKPEGRLIYVDDSFTQAILLCHFLFPSKDILRVFEEKIGLKSIQRFRIIIRRHKNLPVAEERTESMTPEERKHSDKAEIELTSALSGHFDDQYQRNLRLIDKLIKCASAHYEDEENSDLYLDYWVNDATRQAFQAHFSVRVVGSDEASNAASALNLFQSLQTLLTLNYYQVSDETKAELYQSGSLYVNETIPLPASNERIMRFKDFEIIKNDVSDVLYGKALSDGEHQLLHTIGLCLLFRHEPTLFLLDEPETHLNPDWRASYISTLRQALGANETTRDVMREVLLTSHSPFIISDCQPENVLVFEKSKDGEVKWRNPDFNTFGASVSAITIKVFGQTDTIGDYSMATLEQFQERLEEGEKPDILIMEANKALGDSVEKMLFITQAVQQKKKK
jgi:restriction system-associated AAA family ATPase